MYLPLSCSASDLSRVRGWIFVTATSSFFGVIDSRVDHDGFSSKTGVLDSTSPEDTGVEDSDRLRRLMTYSPVSERASHFLDSEAKRVAEFI